MATRNPAVMPTTAMTLLLLKDSKDSLPPVSRIGDSEAKVAVPPPAPVQSSSRESGKFLVIMQLLCS